METSGPKYVSPRSADLILSDVRPIKLRLEALRAVNVLLDEFLYKLLGAAGSLATDQLKSGVNKLLPTTLGMEAVLEAEVELKSYWERNTPHKPAEQTFDLQWSYELLRLKCEAYSTMNDSDEDAEAEKRLSARMMGAGGTAAPHASLVAPAALYLTAILEHVCEHVLSNVSRVASRDSSRAVATAQDLFVALCEDASVYGLFKTMAVYEQIDALSQAQKPRRSKSISKSVDRTPSRGASPPSESVPSRLRVSSESAGSLGGAALAHSRRSSSDSKSRKKFFASHERTESADHDDGNSFELMMDEEAIQEFDELMRSSTTMKVSLTPDRLKTMEVYKQEKRRQKTQENSDPLLVAGAEVKRAVSARRVQPRLVDAITEDDEPPIKGPQPSFQNIITPRSRLASLTHASAVPPTTTSSTITTAPAAPAPNHAPVRNRSVTISTPQVLKRKPSKGQVRSPPTLTHHQSHDVLSPLTPKRENISPVSSMQNGRPQRTRKVVKSRESMDLDDVMGIEEDDLFTPPQTPARKFRDPSKPYVSKTARDLIDFLDDGPPAELQPPNINASVLSLESSKSRSGSGRLQRMMSKLSLGGSSERLNGYNRNGVESPSRMMRSPSSSITSPPPYLPHSLNGMNGGMQAPRVIVATPPPPPSSLASFGQQSFVSSYRSPDSPTPPRFAPTPSPAPAAAPVPASVPVPAPAPAAVSTPPPPPAFVPEPEPLAAPRRASITRKAVPIWDEIVDKVATERFSISPPPLTTTSHVILPTPPPTQRKSSSSKRSSPLDAFPPVPTTPIRTSNGQVYANGTRSDLTITTPTSSRRHSPMRTPSPSTRTPSPNGTVISSGSAKPSSVRQLASSGELSVTRDASLRSRTPTIHEVPVESSAEDPSAMPLADGPTVVAPTTFTSDDAQDLRRMLSVATTADECRLLVDMFLTRSGFARPIPEGEEPRKVSPAVEAAASKIEEFNDGLERSLVALLLGESDDVETSALSAPTPA